jgi:hypothetical protein
MRFLLSLILVLVIGIAIIQSANAADVVYANTTENFNNGFDGTTD